MSLLRRQYNRFLEEKKHSVKDQSIKFLTHKSEYVHLAPPIHAKDYYPRWYKNLSRQDDQNKKTLKTCPSIFDIMTEGYIIPLWLDLKISFTKETGFNWYNKHAHEDTITYHSPNSIGSMPINEGSWNTAMKFSNPWDIVTPPGWSVLITSPWYHRHWEIEIMPSLVETDSYHQMNIPFLYHGKGEKTFRQGMPLIQVIPYKRDGFGTLDNFECRVMNDGDNDYYMKSRRAERTKQNGWYRWLTQQNRKIWKEQGIIDE